MSVSEVVKIEGRQATATSMKSSSSLLRRASSKFIGAFEYLFYQHGRTVCRHPFLYIVSVTALAAVCAIGLLSFHQENRPFKLWIPQDSDFVRTYDWMRQNFPTGFHFENAIITADNVLEPRVIQEMLRIHELVATPPGTGPSWEEVCARLPALVWDGGEGEDNADYSVEDDLAMVKSARRRRQVPQPDFDVSSFDSFDPSVVLPTSFHCSLVAEMTQPCWESGLLELWKYDRDVINNLTLQDVLDTVSTATNSPVFGYRLDLSQYLSGMTYDQVTGRLTGARAAFLSWTVRRNTSAALRSRPAASNDVGTGDDVDPVTGAFEDHFLSAMRTQPSIDEVTWYYQAGKSFGEVSSSAIFGDVQYLVAGYVVMFVYIDIMLGRCNMVEHRSLLTAVGLLGIGLSVLISFGFCSALGLFYGPVHNILPLLLLGLGVDDMFVIVQCWEMLSQDERQRSLEERVARTLQHAGVSITVTSITDFVAFIIGASTVLPSLETFCVYAAVGILAVYLIQATWFVAWFSLDQRRIEERRDGLVPCYRHRGWTPNRLSQRNVLQSFFSNVFSPAILSKPGKVLVVLLTALSLAVNAWGLSQLRQEFNPIWFLPSDSYLSHYHRQLERHFPDRGADGFVFLAGVDFPASLPQMAQLSHSLLTDPDIERVDSWYTEFEYYTNLHEYGELPDRFFEGYDFSGMLGQFLFSPRGGKYQSSFQFNGTLECGSPAPPIKSSMVRYTHRLMDGRNEQIPAMRRVKEIVASVNFTGNVTMAAPLSRAYASWETDEVIEWELYRNMALAMVAVLLMTLLLIADVTVCLLVLTCVVLTLVNVGGVMHFWGLTIDTVSCIDLVLAVGLCVDYAAHVGHTFMTETGSRQQRAHHTLQNIGPAVFNGGFSTFLAFVFLVTSTSHVFITFFKVFLCVTLIGLYHGLVLLPVVLSLCGPQPYITERTEMEMTAKEDPAKLSAATNGHAESNGTAEMTVTEYRPQVVSVPVSEETT